MTRQFPNFLDSYLAYTEGHESTVRVRKWCCLSIIAAALERRVWIDRGYYTLFPNLYTFIIGRSGLVKKSTSTAIAVNLLRELPAIRIMSEKLSATALIHQLSKSGKKYFYKNQKINQSPLFAYASELSVFMTEVWGNITELLTTFYDCQPNDSTKPWVYKTMAHSEMQIFGPCLNILGASTKAWLKKCIPRSEMEGGFTSRIIFVVEENLPDNLVAWPEISAENEKMKRSLIHDLKLIGQLVGEFQIEPDAKETFTKWYNHHMRHVLPKNTDPRMIGYLSRKGDLILKIAMVRSVSKLGDLIMTKEDLLWASEEIDSLERDWLLAFDNVGITGSIAYEVLNSIRSRGIISKHEFWKAMTTIYPADKINEALMDLMESGEVTETIVKKHGQNIESYALPGLLKPTY